MKTPNTEVKNTETQTAPKVTIDDLVNKAKTQKPDGGFINLSEIEKSLKLDRHSTVELAREVKGSFFCAGRKGRESRLVWGNEIPTHINNSRPKTHVKRQVQQTIQESFSSPMLRIKIGKDTYHDLPIELSLVGA